MDCQYFIRRTGNARSLANLLIHLIFSTAERFLWDGRNTVLKIPLKFVPQSSARSLLLTMLAVPWMAGTSYGDVTVSPAKYDFKKVVSTPENNRRATVEAKAFLDPALPDQGFQKAIDSLPASGGEVILPEGEFVLHRSLILRSGVRLRGQKTKLALPSPLISTKLVQPAKEGDRSLIVEDASGFRPGMMIGVGQHGRMLHFFLTQRDEEDLTSVVSVKDNAIELSSPLGARAASKEGSIVANFFPMIYAHSASEIEVRDLEIIGRSDDKLEVHGDYSASAITWNDVTRSRICGVTVRGWKGDAFSLQCGENNLVTDCKAFNAVGRGAKGFHPGGVQDEMILSRSSAENCEGPGLFFCREVKFSVIGNGVFNNNGEMIGGFSAVYDHHNVSNRSYGENNRKGIYFGEGANHVLVGNTLVNTGGIPIEFVGDTKMTKPEAPNWWPRYHVVSGNTISNVTNPAVPLILIKPNTSASLIANNYLQPFDSAIKDEAPGLNLLGNNQLLKDAPAKPLVPPAPPEAPPVVVDAKDSYDPKQPDCGFQAAIDKAAAKGGSVLLPAGVYPLSKGLSLPANVTLRGAGVATVLLWEGEGPVIRSEGSSSIGIRHLSIRQAAANTAASKGIAITNANDVVIEAVLVDDIKGPGMEFSKTGKTLISQSLVSNCAVGMEISDAKELTLAESWSVRNQSDGLRILNALSAVVVDSCIFSANQGSGIAVRSAADNQLSVLSSVVTESGTAGISLRDCTAVTVQGNIIHRGVPTQDKFPAPTSGIRLEGKTSKSSIRENLVTVNAREGQGAKNYALEEVETSDANTIQWNILLAMRGRSNADGDPLRLSGKSSVVKDNVVAPSPLKYLPAKSAGAKGGSDGDEPL